MQHSAFIVIRTIALLIMHQRKKSTISGQVSLSEPAVVRCISFSGCKNHKRSFVVWLVGVARIHSIRVDFAHAHYVEFSVVHISAFSCSSSIHHASCIAAVSDLKHLYAGRARSLH